MYPSAARGIESENCCRKRLSAAWASSTTTAPMGTRDAVGRWSEKIVRPLNKRSAVTTAMASPDRYSADSGSVVTFRPMRFASLTTCPTKYLSGAT